MFIPFGPPRARTGSPGRFRGGYREFAQTDGDGPKGRAELDVVPDRPRIVPAGEGFASPDAIPEADDFVAVHVPHLGDPALFEGFERPLESRVVAVVFPETRVRSSETATGPTYPGRRGWHVPPPTRPANGTGPRSRPWRMRREVERDDWVRAPSAASEKSAPLVHRRRTGPFPVTRSPRRRRPAPGG